MTTFADDTETILADFAESVEIRRRELTYGADGVAATAWSAVATVTGDWQPVTGAANREEKNLAVKSVAQFNAMPDIDAQVDDQVVRADGTVCYVNYVQRHEDHCTVRLKRQEGQT